MISRLGSSDVLGEVRETICQSESGSTANTSQKLANWLLTFRLSFDNVAACYYGPSSSLADKLYTVFKFAKREG